MTRKDFTGELKRFQERKRLNTCLRIDAAAKELKGKHLPMTRKALIEVSGLPRSTFSQPHVKAYILKRWGICIDGIGIS